MLNYSRQNIDKKDIQSVIKSLKSEWLTTGPQIKNFEDDLKEYVNVKYCSVVNSATSALHLSCLALNIKKMIMFGPHLILLCLRLMQLFYVEQK